MYLTCSSCDAHVPFKVMLGLCKWLLWYLWGQLPSNEPFDQNIYHGNLGSTWCICGSKCHKVICMSTVMGHLISLLSEVSVVMMVESYFRCGVWRIFAMMKSASYIWLCNPWTRWCQHLCSAVGSPSGVIVWFSIPWCCRPTFSLIWWVPLMIMI